MSAAVLLAAALAAPLRAQRPDDARRGVAGAIAVLKRGDWNERVHAAYSLEPYGADGLPGLREAALDADWQVRMTAVHLMGRAGPAAIPDLARVLKTEPCRHVRLTAVHWLGSMGPEADAALREGLSDESAMVRLMGRYWLDKSAGERFGGGGPEAASAAAEDLRYCESSSGPGRAPWSAGPAPKAARAPVEETVVTPDPPARPSSPRPAAPTAAETAAQKPAPETLPGGPALPRRAKTAPGGAEYPSARRARLRELDELLAPDARAPQTLPPGAPGLPERPAAAAGEAAIMPDAGTGKPEGDPLPVLRALLRDKDPRKRARAADELGKRGAAAAPAVTELTAALKDRDRRVRASAALALGNVGAASDPSVPALIAALKRGPEDVALSAALALGRIGTPRARRAFARYARQSAGEFLKRTDSDK